MWTESLELDCRCGATTEVFSREWPPVLVYCGRCKYALQLVAYDPETRTTSYRRI